MTSLEEGYFFEPGPTKTNGVPTSMALDLARAVKADAVSFNTFCRRALCAAMGKDWELDYPKMMRHYFPGAG